MAITFQRAGGSTGTSHSIDIGAAGNNRLLVAILGDESNPGASFQGTVSVDGKSFTQAVVAQNVQGAGNHLECHTIDESALGASNGTQTVSYSGGDAGWAIHVLVFYGVLSDTLVDSGLNDTSTDTTPEVTGIDSNDNSLVVMGACSGGGPAGASGWTSPLTERTDSNYPSSAEMATASGIETTGQSSKTYTVTIGTSGYRETAIVVVFDPAVADIEKSVSDSISVTENISVSISKFKLEGVTYNKRGEVLTSAECFVFKDNQDNTLSFVGHDQSDGSGIFSIGSILDSDAQYIVVAFKDDSPHIFDCTDHVLVPEAE